MSNKSNKIDMTGDRLLPGFIMFAIPILISAACQRLFNAADSVIVGRFAGNNALAAVGGVGPVVGLFTWGLMGFSSGADVTISRLFGKKDLEGVRRGIHTAIFIAILAGLTVSLLSFILTPAILHFMDVPEEIFPLSVLYLRIYSVGLFFSVVYNFSAACLRSGGDSKRPTRFMIFAGLVNVILNLIFVCIFHLDVAGVAIATSASNLTAATLTVRTLMKERGPFKLEIKKLCLDQKIAGSIVAIGIPTMMQNALFSVSNMVIQGSINAFGSLTMAANSAATTLEDFVYVATAATNQTCVTFTGQNNGAGNAKNIKKVLIMATAGISILGFLIAFVTYIFANPLLGMFTKDPEVIKLGIIRLKIVALPLFLNGVMDAIAGSMRGMGNSVIPMITSLAGICGLRILFIMTVFKKYQTLSVLYMCYPISWFLTSLVLLFFWIRMYRRFCEKHSVKTV